MQKRVFCGLIAITEFCSQAKAGTGYARDGFIGALLIVCFLFLLAGILEGIQYLNRNGKYLLHCIVAFVKKNLFSHCK